MDRNTYRLETSFDYAELCDDAKATAAAWLNAGGFNRSGEAMDTIKAMAKHFGGRLADCSIDWANPSQSYARFDMPAIAYTEFAKLLGQLGAVDPATGNGIGECKLTGVCYDEDMAYGLRGAFALLLEPEDDRIESDDVNEMMKLAWWRLALACCEEYESQFEEEFLAAACEANNYRFLANGRIVN